MTVRPVGVSAGLSIAAYSYSSAYGQSGTCIDEMRPKFCKVIGSDIKHELPKPKFGRYVIANQSQAFEDCNGCAFEVIINGAAGVVMNVIKWVCPLFSFAHVKEIDNAPWRLRFLAKGVLELRKIRVVVQSI